MAITPQTNLFLLQVTLGLDNKNQLTFNSATEQFEYFSSLTHLEVDNFSYQRKDSIIRYPAHIDSIINYNYVMYQNENYTNKWFYAYITNMRYVNDNLTEISITTDVWQTWQFDIFFKQCFVEREMINVADDVPGANLVPEGLETGEFKVQSSTDLEELKPACVIAYTGNPNEDGLTTDTPPVDKQGVVTNGIPNGVYLGICTINNLQEMLFDINSRGFGEKIMTVFTVPILSVIGFKNNNLNDFLNGAVAGWLVDTLSVNAISKTFNTRPSTIDGYTPKNKKLLTYPYCYFGFNPQNGSSKIFRYEDFANGTPQFNIISEINQNPSVYFIPQNYRGSSNNSMSDCTSLNGYPTIGWSSDYFNAWIAQNGNIISLQANQEQYNYQIDTLRTATTGVSNIAGGAMNGNVSNVVSSSINLPLDLMSKDVNHEYYIKNMLAQIEKQQLLPDKGNLAGSNATLLGYDLMQNNIFTTYTIKKQFAERIDKFFDCYGYLTNQFKTPNINNRPAWNYVKTIGANITGFIPQEDLQAIKQMFDSGITLWHNSNTFLDYTQNNR